MKNKLTIVECTHCGWHHFARARAEVVAEVKRFNKYFNTLSEVQKSAYGGKPSSVALYERCFRCGEQASMRPATQTFTGRTVQPILWEPKDEK